MSKNVGGFMTQLDYDDYSNFCNGWNPYPIVAAIKDRVNFWDSKLKNRS